MEGAGRSREPRRAGGPWELGKARERVLCWPGPPDRTHTASTWVAAPGVPAQSSDVQNDDNQSVVFSATQLVVVCYRKLMPTLRTGGESHLGIGEAGGSHNFQGTRLCILGSCCQHNPQLDMTCIDSH